MGILCVFCVYDTIGNRCFEKTSFPKTGLARKELIQELHATSDHIYSYLKTTFILAIIKFIVHIIILFFNMFYHFLTMQTQISWLLMNLANQDPHYEPISIIEIAPLDLLEI